MLFRGKKPEPSALRPCLVDGEPAFFHRWADEDRGMLRVNVFVRPEEQAELNRRFHNDGIIPHCCSMEALRRTLALVEYPDGTVAKVDPAKIRFQDREES